MQFPERVISQNDEEKKYWDNDGALRTDMHVEDGWTSKWLDFTIKGSDDWLNTAIRLTFNPSRIYKTTMEQYQYARQAGKFCMLFRTRMFSPYLDAPGDGNDVYVDVGRS